MRIALVLLITLFYLLPSAAWSRCVQGDCLNGQGTVVMQDGRKYVGEFQNGVRVGQGLMTFPDGTKYLGNWQQDKPDGQGKLSSAGKYEYVGEFKNGVRHGQGTLETVDGKTYEGQWEKDVPHGHGKIIYPDGASYTGQFKNGKRHGDGQAIYVDGSSYAGQWQDDVQSGNGTMTFANGELYTGEFSNDQRHGIGTLITPDGSKYLVHWQEDVLIKKEEIESPEKASTAEKIEPDKVEITGDEPAKEKVPVALQEAVEEKPVIAEPPVVTEKTTTEASAEEQQPVIAAVVDVESQTVKTVEGRTVAKAGFASVQKNGVYVRSGPSPEYRIIRSVNKGYPVEILERQDDWVRVQDYLGNEGWIFSTLLGNNNSVIVSTIKANLRSGPGTENMIVGKLDYGTVLLIRKIRGAWYMVETKGGSVGWLNHELVWPSGHVTAQSVQVEETQTTAKETPLEADSAVDTQVEESVLEQLKEQEIARQYEAEASSMESLQLEQAAVLPDKPEETVTEKTLVVEAKPIAESGETSRQKDDEIAAVVVTGEVLGRTSYASVTSQGKGANIRSGPSLNSEVLRAVPTGYPLLVIDQQDNWSLVEDFRQRQGWVYTRLLTGNNTVVVKVGKGNLRSGPSLSDEITAKIDYGMVMYIEERLESWIKVKGSNGLVGWLHKEVIWP
jgi:SH3-like domain-containing protein